LRVSKAEVFSESGDLAPMFISELREHAADPKLGLYNDQTLQFLTLRPDRSEIEFLHGFESCRVALDHADKTRQLCLRGLVLLPLWIRLGRPHPLVLRRFLLGSQWPSVDLSEVDPKQIEDFVDWSCEAYEAVRADSREIPCDPTENPAQPSP
jgi:hypothetical protein